LKEGFSKPRHFLNLVMGEEAEEVCLCEKSVEVITAFFSKIINSTIDSARAIEKVDTETLRHAQLNRIELAEEVIEAVFAANDSGTAKESLVRELISDLGDVVVKRDERVLAGKEFIAAQRQVDEFSGAICEVGSLSALF